MRSQTGRASLLQALSLGCQSPVVLAASEHESWGYVLQPEKEKPKEPGEDSRLPIISPPEPNKPVRSTWNFRNPLRMPGAWIVTTTPSERRNEIGPEHSWDELGPLTDAELVPPDEPKGRYQDLVPLTRLGPALKSLLGQQHGYGVNVAALVRHAANRQWPRQLPMLQRRRWCDELVLALDFSRGLYPYRYDMHRLAIDLHRQFPHQALQVWLGQDGPHGEWVLYDPQRQTEEASVDGLPTPKPHQTLLLVSDLGLLSNHQGPSAVWLRWVRQVEPWRRHPWVLAPIAELDLARMPRSRVRVVRWSPDSRLRLTRRAPALPSANEQEQDSPELLHALAQLGCFTRVDPPLLRTLRRLGPTPRDASLEGRLWSHPKVVATHFARLRHDDTALQATQLDEHAKAQCLSLLNEHHSHWPLALGMNEKLRWVRAAGASPQREATLTEVRVFLRRLIDETLTQPRHNVRAAASYLLAATGSAGQALVGDLLSDIANAMGETQGDQIAWALVQVGPDLSIVPTPVAFGLDRLSDERAIKVGGVLMPNIGFAARGERVVWEVDHQTVVLALPLDAEPLRLVRPQSRACLWLGGQKTDVVWRERPQGITGWRQDEQGLSVEFLNPEPGSEGASTYPFERGIAVGLQEDAYGLFWDLHVKTQFGEAAQRLRYLPPATFLMGSPDGVGHDDEHPQHPVTLTQGFWMADTPVTQGLWRAVMGNNPSHFKLAPDAVRLPVESVSHEDAREFLKRLQALIPSELEVTLPTEAQWEYACRAGTSTAYAWGDEFDANRANVDVTGDRNVADTDGTSPVDRYPPNSWGLYDLHGNVWEWCADGQRPYQAQAERDPEGPRNGASFVVRGGSWFSPPGNARSASRPRRHAGYRSHHLGFRFALRSSSTSRQVGPEGRD